MVTPELFLPDDRLEYFSIPNNKIKESAEGVVALFTEGMLAHHGNGIYLPKKQYIKAECGGQLRPLCDDEQFRGQPSGAILTGVLVSEDVIVTTNHGLPASDSQITKILFVFDFRFTDEQSEGKILKENIFRGKCVIKRGVGSADFALIRLNRKAPAQRVRKIKSAGIELLDGRLAYVLGHPCGLPLKFGGTVTVRDVNGEDFFRADFDTYIRNSGSPVFDLESHEVIGIVTRDNAEDFVPDNGNNCCRSNVVTPSHLSGDECVKASLFSGFISHDCPS